MKIIEMVKDRDGVYKQIGEVEPEPASFKRVKKPKVKKHSSAVEAAINEVNNELEELGFEALNILTRGIFGR